MQLLTLVKLLILLIQVSPSTVTYGTNDDTVTATTAQTLALEGGAGNDSLNMPADMDRDNLFRI